MSSSCRKQELEFIIACMFLFFGQVGVVERQVLLGELAGEPDREMGCGSIIELTVMVSELDPDLVSQVFGFPLLLELLAEDVVIWVAVNEILPVSIWKGDGE